MDKGSRVEDQGSRVAIRVEGGNKWRVRAQIIEVV